LYLFVQGMAISFHYRSIAITHARASRLIAGEVKAAKHRVRHSGYRSKVVVFAIDREGKKEE